MLNVSFLKWQFHWFIKDFLLPWDQTNGTEHQCKSLVMAVIQMCGLQIINVCFPWKQKGRIYNFAFSALDKAPSIRTNTQPVHFWNLSRGTASQALATAAFSNTFWLPLALQKKTECTKLRSSPHYHLKVSAGSRVTIEPWHCVILSFENERRMMGVH